jgi:D-lactate dehydrogenase (cytochrome)
VGILKKEDMLSYKSTIEINLMKALKTSIDPKNIMNPGKIF